jgi:EAL domain-containing protein (putative c-di-GMP-specific phosphodiesterase class I)
MEIVAEGIETETQLAYVTGARCTAAQGFYLGRPMPQAAIARLLDAQARGESWDAEADADPSIRLRQA